VRWTTGKEREEVGWRLASTGRGRVRAAAGPLREEESWAERELDWACGIKVREWAAGKGGCRAGLLQAKNRERRRERDPFFPKKFKSILKSKFN